MLSGDRFGHERIEHSHQDSAGHTELNSPGTQRLSRSLAAPICKSVDDDRHYDQHNSTKQQQRTALGGNEVIKKDADNQCETDADWKGHCQPCDLDGSDQQEIGNVEDHSSEQCKSDVL